MPQPIDQRRFRANDDKANALDPAKGDDGFMIGHIQRYAGGVRGNAGVAGRCIECIAKRRLRQLPCQRMFTPATADQKDVHARPNAL